MLGGCPGYYEFVWKMKTEANYPRLAVPVSFIFGTMNFNYQTQQLKLMF